MQTPNPISMMEIPVLKLEVPVLTTITVGWILKLTRIVTPTTSTMDMPNRRDTHQNTTILPLIVITRTKTWDTMDTPMVDLQQEDLTNHHMSLIVWKLRIVNRVMLHHSVKLLSGEIGRTAQLIVVLEQGQGHATIQKWSLLHVLKNSLKIPAVKKALAVQMILLRKQSVLPCAQE